MTRRIAQTSKSSSSRHVLKRGFIVSDETLNLECTVKMPPKRVRPYN
jgi:hypothetical protein